MDLKLLMLINREWTAPAMDLFMALVSSLSFWMPVLVIVCLLFVWRGGFRGRALVVCIAVGIAVGDGLVTRHAKKIIGRPRPEKVIDGVRLVNLARVKPEILALYYPPQVKLSAAEAEPGRGTSCPSAHTVNNFLVATLVAIFFRFGWLAFLPACAVGYSRVYTGSHWPSDVLVSIPLGIGLALLVFCLLEWLWRAAGPSLTPRLHAAHPSLRPA